MEACLKKTGMNTKAFCPSITKDQPSEKLSVEQMELLPFLWPTSVGTRAKQTNKQNGDLPPTMLLNSISNKELLLFYNLYSLLILRQTASISK